jgi:hypothetical protein
VDYFFEHQPDLLGRLTARGILYECIYVTPSFFHITSTYWKHACLHFKPLDLLPSDLMFAFVRS